MLVDIGPSVKRPSSSYVELCIEQLTLAGSEERGKYHLLLFNVSCELNAFVGFWGSVNMNDMTGNNPSNTYTDVYSYSDCKTRLIYNAYILVLQN